jgi:hypothetical protein
VAAAIVAIIAFRKEIIAGFGAALDVVKDFATRAGKNLEGFKNILIGIATADFTKAKEGFSQLFDLSGEGERAAATFSDSYAKRMEQFKAEEEERQNEIRELKVKKAQEENELLLEKDRELKEGLAAQRLEFDEAQIEQDIEKAEKLQEVQDKATKEADKKKKKAAQDQANLEQASANASGEPCKVNCKPDQFCIKRREQAGFCNLKRGCNCSINHRNPSCLSTSSSITSRAPATFPLAAQVRAAGALNTAAIVAQTFTAQKGFSGGGSPFGESLVSTFTPREIVVPERFSEGIKRGEFSLESSKKKEGEGSGGAMQVVIGFTDDAFEIIEEKLIERQVLSQRLGAILMGSKS